MKTTFFKINLNLIFKKHTGNSLFYKIVAHNIKCSNHRTMTFLSIDTEDGHEEAHEDTDGAPERREDHEADYIPMPGKEIVPGNETFQSSIVFARGLTPKS